MRPLVRPRVLNALPVAWRRSLYAGLRPRKFSALQHKRSDTSTGSYTFAPYDRHRCIFVHIPKTAGMSVCRSLFGNLAGGHATLADYQIVFSPAEFAGYYKFTFVRNPWDRVYSAYRFLRGGGATEFDRRWARNLLEFDDFNDFVRRGLSTPKMRRKLHFLPQVQFLVVPFNPASRVDFLGYFENLAEDFGCIAARLNLLSMPTLQHVNQTGARECDYRDAYADDTREIVKKLYRDDIECLEYNFDNSSLVRQLARRRVRSM